MNSSSLSSIYEQKMALCGICNHDVEEEEETNDEAFDCDNCEISYHIKCVKVVRKCDVKTRKSSKSLKILCPDCIESTDKTIEKKVMELLKVVYKIDMCFQQRKASDQSDSQMMIDMAKSLLQLNEKVDKIENRMINIEDKSHDEPSKNQSYAKIVKQNSVKPVVVVKPKQKQDSKKTMDEITNTVGETEINVCDTRNIRDGGVILCCNSANDTMKVKQIMREKLGDNYEVDLPKI